MAVADLKLGIRPRPNPRDLYSWLFLGEVFGKHRESTDITLWRWGIDSSRDLEGFSAAKISDIDQHHQSDESQRPSTTCRRCSSASDFSLGRPLGLRHFLCYYSQPLLLVTASKDEVNNHDCQAFEARYFPTRTIVRAHGFCGARCQQPLGG